MVVGMRVGQQASVCEFGRGDSATPLLTPLSRGWNGHRYPLTPPTVRKATSGALSLGELSLPLINCST